jgi:purine-binding chemotaxis protein CheW
VTVPEIAGSTDARVKLAAFRVGSEVYALDVAHVREVVRWQPVTPLPRAPRLIEGVIDLRGAVVPVVDLGRVLGDAAVTAGPAARIAIVVESGLVMGLAVDAALAVMSVDPAELEDPPALATHAGYDAARAVVRRPDAAPVLLLSLEYILESVYRSARQVSRSEPKASEGHRAGEAERSAGPRESGEEDAA